MGSSFSSWFRSGALARLLLAYFVCTAQLPHTTFSRASNCMAQLSLELASPCPCTFPKCSSGVPWNHRQHGPIPLPRSLLPHSLFSPTHVHGIPQDWVSRELAAQILSQARAWGCIGWDAHAVALDSSREQLLHQEPAIFLSTYLAISRT